MPGKNWNSKSKTLSTVVKKTTIQKAQTARALRQNGRTVKQIAAILKLSVSRIYEYLK